LESEPSRTAGSEQETSPNSSPAAKTEGDRKYHLRLGTITVGAGYFSGPFFYPYGPYSWYPSYGAGFWDPFWGPYSSFGYLPNLSYGNDKGEIRLTTDPKQAEVYIDGAYAGTADHLKTIWLDPGAYDLSVSHTGRESFHQRIYILTGKLLKVTAKLATQGSIAGTKEEKP
jgi:PEGA domain